jgi:hypothetical protein
MLGVIAGPKHAAVDQPGRRRHLGEDGRRILLAGVVEDPGQKLGPFPRRASAAFGAQERTPLRPGQVLLDEGKNLTFLVRQVIQHDRRQELDGCRHTILTSPARLRYTACRSCAPAKLLNERFGDGLLAGQREVQAVGLQQARL